MYAALLMAGTIYPGDVDLHDAERFLVDARECKWMWELARDQMTSMRSIVHTYNTPRMIEAWEEEAAWRRDCWDELDWVIRIKPPDERKRYHLERLRKLLGDADYYSGRMPLPCPAYKQ